MNNKFMSNYFLLYSYVHINCSRYEALIVNTESGKTIITQNVTFIKLFSKLKLPTIYYMIQITDELCNDIGFFNLLHVLEEEFCGEIISCIESNRPIQFSPQLKMSNNSPLDNDYLSSFDFINSDVVTQSMLDKLGHNILSNVLELSIYYNTLLTDKTLFNKIAHNQFLFPVIARQEMKLKNLNAIFDYSYPKLCKINIIVGKLDSADIEYLTACIQKYALSGKVTLYVTGEIYNDIDNDFITLFNRVYVWNNRWIVCQKVAGNQINLFLAENDTDLQMFENNSDIDEIFPLYNGENLNFCRNYLSFNRTDILNEEFSEREIFMNQYINTNFYGELSIFPDGNVYSCKNKISIGNIMEFNMKEILLSEFCNHRNWFITRNKISKCKDCVLNWICPPITHMELSMKAWQLCQV